MYTCRGGETELPDNGGTHTRMTGYVESTPGKYFGIVLTWRDANGRLPKAWKVDEDLVVYYWIDGRPYPSMQYSINHPGAKNPLPLSGLWPSETERCPLQWARRAGGDAQVEPNPMLFAPGPSSINTGMPPPLETIEDFASMRVTVHKRILDDAGPTQAGQSPMPRNRHGSKASPEVYVDSRLSEYTDLDCSKLSSSMLQFGNPRKELLGNRGDYPRSLPFLEFRIYYKSKSTLQSLDLLKPYQGRALLPMTNVVIDGEATATTRPPAALTASNEGPLPIQNRSNPHKVLSKRPSAAETTTAPSTKKSRKNVIQSSEESDATSLPPVLSVHTSASASGSPAVPQIPTVSTQSGAAQKPGGRFKFSNIEVKQEVLDSSLSMDGNSNAQPELAESQTTQLAHSDTVAADSANEAGFEAHLDYHDDSAPMDIEAATMSAAPSKAAQPVAGQLAREPVPPSASNLTQVATSIPTLPGFAPLSAPEETSTARSALPISAEPLSRKSASTSQQQLPFPQPGFAFPAPKEEDRKASLPPNNNFFNGFNTASTSAPASAIPARMASTFIGSAPSTPTMSQSSSQPSSTQSQGLSKEQQARDFLSEEALDLADEDNVKALMFIGFKSKTRFLRSIKVSETVYRDQLLETLRGKMGPSDFGILEAYLRENGALV